MLSVAQPDSLWSGELLEHPTTISPHVATSTVPTMPHSVRIATECDRNECMCARIDRRGPVFNYVSGCEPRASAVSGQSMFGQQPDSAAQTASNRPQSDHIETKG
jgi:hypothetical protein